MNLSGHTIESILGGYRQGEFKPSEILSEVLSAINTQNRLLNMFLEVQKEKSLQLAKEMDCRTQGDRSVPTLWYPYCRQRHVSYRGLENNSGFTNLGTVSIPLHCDECSTVNGCGRY